jgi:uncharacterized protein YkwD
MLLLLGLLLAPAAQAQSRAAAALSVLKAQNPCGKTDDPSAPARVQEAAMECLINKARAAAGLGKLNDTPKLDGAAASKSSDILRCNQFSHGACGRDFLYWFRRSGFLDSRCWWAGENLAYGTGDLASPRSILRSWLHSPGHRANLLSSTYDQAGISLRIGSLAGNGDAHLWVNHFGRHC